MIAAVEGHAMIAAVEGHAMIAAVCLGWSRTPGGVDVFLDGIVGADLTGAQALGLHGG